MLGFINGIGMSRTSVGVSFDINTVSKTVWFSAIGSTVTEGAGKVTGISDLSGNSNNLSLSSGGTNECIYSASYAAANGHPAFVFANSDHDTHFRVGGNITLQDLYIVCHYKDGIDRVFDNAAALLGGSGSFGALRIAGSTGTASFLSTSHFASEVSRAGGGFVTSALPMGFNVFRFKAASPQTDQFYFFGGSATPRGWNGHICEVIGLAAAADDTTAENIKNYLETKYSIPQNRFNALITGQSLAHQLATTNSGSARDAFLAELQTHGFTSAYLINGGKASAAVRYEADVGAGAFLNAANDGEGAVFASHLVASVDMAGIDWEDIDAVFYLIGNTDQGAIQAGTITEAQHRTGFQTFVALVKARAPNALHIPIPNVGKNDLTSSSHHDAWTAIKRAQWQVSQEDASCYDCFGTFDLTRADAEHLDTAGYELLGRRMARLAAHHRGLGSPNNPLGARITGATYNAAADSVTVTVAHDAGTDFTISDPDGFWVHVNGTKQQPTTVTRNSATSFTLSGGLTMASGNTVTLSWPCGTSENMTIANIFLDNAANPLPLQPVFGLNVTEL